MYAGGIFWLCAICPVVCRVLAILQSSCADGWIPALPCHAALAQRSRSVSLILQEPNACCPWAWNTKGQQAATKSINSKSYEESFVFPLLCAGVNGFAQQRSSPRDFLAASPDGASKASPPAERAPPSALAGRAVTTPRSAFTCKPPGPNTSQPRKISSFSGRLPPPRSLSTQESHHAVCFALPCRLPSLCVAASQVIY